jgi:hypothetical protein
VKPLLQTFLSEEVTEVGRWQNEQVLTAYRLLQDHFGDWAVGLFSEPGSLRVVQNTEGQSWTDCAFDEKEGQFVSAEISLVRVSPEYTFRALAHELSHALIAAVDPVTSMGFLEDHRLIEEGVACALESYMLHREGVEPCTERFGSLPGPVHTFGASLHSTLLNMAVANGGKFTEENFGWLTTWSSTATDQVQQGKLN